MALCYYNIMFLLFIIKTLCPLQEIVFILNYSYFIPEFWSYYLSIHLSLSF